MHSASQRGKPAQATLMVVVAVLVDDEGDAQAASWSWARVQSSLPQPATAAARSTRAARRGVRFIAGQSTRTPPRCAVRDVGPGRAGRGRAPTAPPPRELT